MTFIIPKKWNYYNDNDQKCCAWGRELIKATLIPDGEIDDRPIQSVRGDDLKGFVQCHFFVGIFGWPYALRLAGWPDDKPVWTGSCPCQPFSQAGKGKGVEDKRHLWPDFRKLIEECAPSAVFGEQVASKAGRRWLNGVRTDLEAMDYEVGASDLCSAGVGAPHIRQRLYWVAQSEHTIGRPEHKEHSEEHGRNRFRGGRESFRLGHATSGGLGIGRDETFAGSSRHADSASITRGMGDSYITRPQGRRIVAGEYADQCSAWTAGSLSGMGESYCAGRFTGRQAGEAARYRDTAQSAGYWDDFDIVRCTDNKARRIEPGTFPLAHGIPARMGRLRGYGNAITPQVAAAFVIACMEIGL